VLRLCSGKEKTRTIEKARSRVEERTVTVFNQLSRVVHLSRLEICPNGPSHVYHERPKRVLGGLTPVEYARRLTEKVITIPGKL